MNMFILDLTPQNRAQAAFDCHTHWLAKEVAQMLSNARLQAGLPAPYRLAQPHHPLSRWVCSSRAAYLFALDHGRALLDEYAYRSGHRSVRMDQVFAELAEPPPQLPDCPMPPFPVCRAGRDPVVVATLEEAVALHREYYLEKASSLPRAVRTRRPAPEWTMM